MRSDVRMRLQQSPSERADQIVIFSTTRVLDDRADCGQLCSLRFPAIKIISQEILHIQSKTYFTFLINTSSSNPFSYLASIGQFIPRHGANHREKSEKEVFSLSLNDNSKTILLLSNMYILQAVSFLYCRVSEQHVFVGKFQQPV